METFTAPVVELVGITAVTGNILKHMDMDYSSKDPDVLAEFGGRGCYDAYDKPREGTRANVNYLNNIIELGHTSVLAHASASFLISGISRSLAQELIRSRFLAFSEISQRYVDAGTLGFVVPPDADEKEIELLRDTNEFARLRYRDAVLDYERRGFERKRARSAARAHLPLSTETRMLASGNMRAWRDFLNQRLSPHADEEIQNLAHLILAELEDVAPNTFQDIVREYKDDSRVDRLRGVR